VPQNVQLEHYRAAECSTGALPCRRIFNWSITVPQNIQLEHYRATEYSTGALLCHRMFSWNITVPQNVQLHQNSLGQVVSLMTVHYFVLTLKQPNH